MFCKHLDGEPSDQSLRCFSNYKILLRRAPRQNIPSIYHRFKAHSLPSTIDLSSIYGQRRAKRDLRTYAKSVDSDQPPRLRRCVWSESALFDTCHINSTDISCCVSNWISIAVFNIA